MNSTATNSTADPFGVASGADSHGSLYKIIGVTLAIASGKMSSFFDISSNIFALTEFPVIY